MTGAKKNILVIRMLTRIAASTHFRSRQPHHKAKQPQRQTRITNKKLKGIERQRIMQEVLLKA
jgi:hypothetical protein